MLHEAIPKRGQYFYKLIRSYLLITLIPFVFLFAVVIFGCVRGIQSEAIDAQESFCAQLAQSMSVRFGDVQAATKAMSIDRLFLDSQCTDEDIVQRLRLYLNVSHEFQDILLYRRGAFYLSAADRGRVDFSEQNRLNKKETAYLNAYVTDRKPHLSYFPSSDQILWIDPYDDFSLVCVIQKQVLYEICNITEEDALRYGALEIYDFQKQRVLLIDLKNVIQPVQDYSWSASKNHTYECAIGTTGWGVRLVLPEAFVQSRTHIYMLLVLFFFVLLFTLSLIWIISNKFYHPIKQLSILAEQDTSEDDFSSNELSTISTALITGNRLSRQISEQNNTLRENVILQLIHGNYATADEIQSVLIGANMLQDAQECQVAVIRPFNAELDKRYQLVLDYIDVRYSRKDCAYALDTEADQQKLLVILMKRTEDTPACSSTLADLRLFVLHHFQCEILIGVGNPHPIPNLSVSFMEALTALSFCKENHLCQLYSSLVLTEEDVSIRRIDFLKKLQILRHSILEINESLAFQTWEELYQGYCGRNRWQFYAYQVIELLFQMVCENQQNVVADQYQLLMQKLRRAQASNVCSEQKQYIDSVLPVLLGIYKAENEKKEQKEKNKMLLWLNQHICDANLSLDLLSDTFGYSPSYWSRTFSDQVGISFGDWVWQERIRIFKDRLLHTNTSIKELVQSIGYTDVSSFTRRFRKEEGLPPGQYRQHFSTSEVK